MSNLATISKKEKMKPSLQWDLLGFPKNEFFDEIYHMTMQVMVTHPQEQIDTWIMIEEDEAEEEHQPALEVIACLMHYFVSTYNHIEHLPYMTYQELIEISQGAYYKFLYNWPFLQTSCANYTFEAYFFPFLQGYLSNKYGFRKHLNNI